MPTAGNAKRTVRVDDPTWDDYLRACEAVGINEHVMLLTLIRWWGRQPGVTLPPRPPRPPASS